jgi:glycosyltransferase involved in cell wall biosynthesis
MAMAKRRLLIAHPYISPVGGGNTVAAWALQALRETWDVSLATLEPVDCAAVNRSFGTALAEGDFKTCLAPRSYANILRCIPTPGALAELCVTMRWAKALDKQHRYPVLLSTQNECDFDRKGLQYIHYPWLYLPRPEIEMRWFHRIPGLLAVYWGACQRAGQVTDEGLRRNQSLANSEFVAGRIREVHGMDSVVLYPPVPGEFPDVPWGEKCNAFVAVGRIHGVKRWEDAVRILDAVRARGHALDLTVIGHRYDREYGARLEALARSRPWFRILHDLGRKELAAEIARHRYGIHPMHDEHFGIAPAEIQRAGCITFVHNSGGPVEIVGKRPELTFETVEDAASKICRVLKEEALRRELRAHVAAQRDRFSAERFCESLRGIVEEFAAGDAAAALPGAATHGRP